MSKLNDTSEDAYRMQLELLRQMSPEERVLKVSAWSGQIKRMAMDAIRRRHPEFDDDEVRVRFVELTYGQELADGYRNWLKERAVG